MPELDFLQNLDIEKQALVFLLMLPIVASIVGIARHIIGVKSLGIYAPIILTFSLYALGLNGKYGEYSDIWAGLKYGLIFVPIIIATSLLGTTLVKRSHMHYFPKISINLSLVAIALLITLVLADILGRDGFNSTNALALVMIASVAEQFTATLFKKKLVPALLITLETMLTSFFCYILIAWPEFQDLVIKFPYIILITFVLNYIIGKYKGLRFREYFRFRTVLNDISDEDEE
jgi:hypothetical protein